MPASVVYGNTPLCRMSGSAYENPGESPTPKPFMTPSCAASHGFLSDGSASARNQSELDTPKEAPAGRFWNRRSTLNDTLWTCRRPAPSRSASVPLAWMIRRRVLSAIAFLLTLIVTAPPSSLLRRNSIRYGLLWPYRFPVQRQFRLLCNAFGFASDLFCGCTRQNHGSFVDAD